ncbi:MAG: hypothetical protein HQK79_15450 [Desulfobacterales bacterium]|nr:hypothetical protein [Desulfobacterales bacterium]MBF0395438.1 hypothetical protein [Desulfobacterales bacterium]
MKMYLKEKIGDPILFTGRKKELSYFLKWIDGIKKGLSKSTAILSRRKTGKTAVLQRLYNITFDNNNGIIPFYYEVKEGNKWAIDFCRDFFLTFLYQYLAYKTRKSEYISLEDKSTYETAIQIAKKEKQTHLLDLIRSVSAADKNESVDTMWLMVRDAPLSTAIRQNEYIVQILDEFQYLNRYIYRDKATTHQISDFVGGYLSTAEYRNAPLIVSGSWVGWLLREIQKLLPSRFKKWTFTNMPQDEAIEMIFRYSDYYQIPIEKDIAFLMAELTEGNPFYISALFTSMYQEKKFTTETGLRETIEFEILNTDGEIKGTWMEYIEYAFSELNGKDQGITKQIMMYLCQNKEREVSRKEIHNKLQLPISEYELEKRLDTLVKCDIIEQGRSKFYYQGIKDHFFDKIFFGEYEDDIYSFDPKEVTNNYKALFEKWKHNFHVMAGKYGQLKGIFGEYMIIKHLKYKCLFQQESYISMTFNLPKDFKFAEYESVWKYMTSPIDKNPIEIDIFAKAPKNDYSLIVEVKNRDIKFNKEDAENFLKKANLLVDIEKINKSIFFVFSINGFTQDAILFFESNKIAWSDDSRWLE